MEMYSLKLTLCIFALTMSFCLQIKNMDSFSLLLRSITLHAAASSSIYYLYTILTVILLEEKK